jgi:RNA polymerase sigma factor (TIGR02999 family)
MSPNTRQITTLLADIREGRPEAAEQLLEIVYQDLRRLAAHQFQQENAGHTLQPTALVHELYMRLFAGEPVACQDRGHFFAIAAQQIRRILVDHARARRAKKRGGEHLRVTITDLSTVSDTDEDLLAVDVVLSRLQRLDSRAAKVVELRFFAGLEEKEIAEFLGVSVATVKRDWIFARAWLETQLKPTQK